MLAAVVTAAFFLAQPCDSERSRLLAEEARRDHDARQFEVAAKRFREAFEACVANQSLRLEEANSLLMGGRVLDALTLIKDVLQTDPGNAAALKIKGNAEYL